MVSLELKKMICFAKKKGFPFRVILHKIGHFEFHF